MKYRSYILVSIVIGTLIPSIAYAQFSNVLSNFFYLLVGIAVLLAVLAIAYGGIIYMASDAITQKSDAREWIVSALIGLLIVLGGTLILSIINPGILTFDINLGAGSAPTGSSAEQPKPSSGLSEDARASLNLQAFADNPTCRPALERAARTAAGKDCVTQTLSVRQCGETYRPVGRVQFVGSNAITVSGTYNDQPGGWEETVSGTALRNALSKELSTNPVEGCAL